MTAQRDYDALVQRGLSLDLTRGKPSPRQLDLSDDLLKLPTSYRAADGTDGRNYGNLQGLAELRELFAPLLQVPAGQLVVGGNASLALMHDTVVHALLSPVPGAERRWVEEPEITFLCPVPGYDRHFTICERLGIKMVPVPMTADGPDMDVVERLVAGDASVKGMWCVPKYSNPTGAVYSDETVRRLAAMPTAAPDFRIFWDNAYAVHHLTDSPVELADLLALAVEAGNPDRVFVYASTSKVTLAGSGVSFFGSSPANVEWFLRNTAKQSIGPDKINQLRHVEFLRDPAGVEAHMRKHAALIGPKFELVDKVLSERLGGLASWTSPKGGYFISLEVPHAAEVVAKAKAAGIALTPAGATHPYGKDPEDRTIRIAPTYPELEELEQAIEGLAVCVRLVAEKHGVA
ncbi:aminotransferase class I/II-fold pyridoxal phosphate-dependent enzyme [Nonomuraea wenchangensis]|uniref:DNA-binding transcriptional regulator, MocR family, contains an aminotransferase domain n=1 Tax=Nonomuraea wenchangensis TaxID=568860 RepID=A0A1I0IZX4_9ACTN|nr:aminotransferase class I/II-fold pyridoxal phosphate-dependent enzyme [Nonomuraea wenchangensis]SEU02747.1 DNA-binding transcriptional regulator, MocR family, contains an aminotransferase domain [Nonomuraea wenchangensis]